MKVYLIQPSYSEDYSKSEEYLQRELALMDSVPEDADIVVLPESADEPCFGTSVQMEYNFAHYTQTVLAKAQETARRANTMVFINANDEKDGMHLNTTYAIGRDGEIKGRYYKSHPTPGEMKNRHISGYTEEYDEAQILEMEGLRFAFLTCYDFYFFEMCGQLARKKPDIIIGCSHQRTDSHTVLEMLSAFFAHGANAYLLRSSVSMGEDSSQGGCSLVAAPNGEVLLNMKNRAGMESVTIDPSAKFLRPAGYKNPLSSHPDYIENGRRPWKYRPAGPGICLNDAQMPYPRVCAHRGFNTVCPENSLPAFGAAVALGAEEIEFDLWYTKDGEIVSTHDRRLERTSNGSGFVFEHTLEELRQLDFGRRAGDHFRGLSVLTFEEILQKFACRTVMNIHLKHVNNTDPLDEAYLKKIIALIDKYDCRKYVYFMTGNDTVLRQLKALAPDIALCCGAGDDHFGIVERAIACGCSKVQFFKPNFDAAMFLRAKEARLKINIFWSDEPEEAQLLLRLGADTILTNDYLTVANAVRKMR